MEQAIEAYRRVSTSPEFRELERMRSDTRRNEAAALHHAAEVERKKWQSVVAEKDAAFNMALAEKDAENQQLRSQIEELQAKIKRA